MTFSGAFANSGTDRHDDAMSSELLRAGIYGHLVGDAELEGDNIRGVGVHIAARIAALAGPGEVYASWATRELLAGSAIGFTDRGLQELKGLSEPRRVYLVG